ncbi:MAG: response regulator, partial [Rhodothermales bacterium]|nr:response regulator [Rhodothermales bacterium]
RPDLILMDLRMPLMDGLEATQQLRADADAALQHVPVVFLTAENDLSQVLRALSYGIEGYLLKPIRPEAVTEKVTDVLLNAA